MHSARWCTAISHMGVLMTEAGSKNKVRRPEPSKNICCLQKAEDRTFQLLRVPILFRICNLVHNCYTMEPQQFKRKRSSTLFPEYPC